MNGTDEQRPRSRPGGEGRHFEHLLKVRYLALVVVVLAVLHALAFLFMAAETALEAYAHLLGNRHAGMTERPGLEVLHSVDFMLVSLVLMILAVGVAKLFLLPAATAERSASYPTWLEIESFSDLKHLLWETILSALLVASLSSLTAGLFGDLEWNALVIPAAILLLALSLYLMKKA